MKQSTIVADLAADYEQEYGQKPTGQALQVAEHIVKVGAMLTELGRKNAQQGESAYSADVFPALVVKVFRLDVDEDHEMVQAVADLWQFDYMDGYQKGGAV